MIFALRAMTGGGERERERTLTRFRGCAPRFTDWGEREREGVSSEGGSFRGQVIDCGGGGAIYLLCATTG